MKDLTWLQNKKSKLRDLIKLRHNARQRTSDRYGKLDKYKTKSFSPVVDFAFEHSAVEKQYKNQMYTLFTGLLVSHSCPDKGQHAHSYDQCTILDHHDPSASQTFLL
jgi:gentisate 1,2-dioxygenase